MKSQTLTQHNINIVKELKKSVTNKVNLINEEHSLNHNVDSVCRITTKNTIKFCNADFINLSGYTGKDLLNNSLNLIKHPEMPSIISKFIANRTENGEITSSIIKNKTKDGKFYWTHATFKPNEGSNLNIAFTINSSTISDQAKEQITKLYDCLYKLESKIDENTAAKYLVGFLEEKCMSLTQYTKYLVSL